MIRFLPPSSLNLVTVNLLEAWVVFLKSTLIDLKSLCTSASHQISCPIKCSLESEMSLNYFLNGEWHIVHHIGDREWLSANCRDA